MLQWNCRSIRKNIFSLKFLIDSIKPIVICLQETWLVDNTDLNYMKNILKNHEFYFKKRHSPSGGVGLLIHKSIPHIENNLNSHLEAIAYNIKYKNKLITVCSLYLPPAKKITVNSLDNIFNKYFNQHILMGDINGHNTLWGSQQNNYRGNKFANFINKSI